MRVLIAWELGGNWGHLSTLLPIARELRARGHEVLFAVRALDADLGCLLDEGYRCLPYPMALSPLQRHQGKPVRSYAEAMTRVGFDDPDTLAHLAHAWQSLLGLVQPDVVVGKYAPLAQFATRDVPLVVLGTGFELPPLTSPLPPFVQVTAGELGSLQHVEARIVEIANQVGQRYGWRPVEAVHELLASGRRLLLTWQETDHYHRSEAEPYLGPLFGGFAGIGSDARIYGDSQPSAADLVAYLRMGGRWWDEVARAKRQLLEAERWTICDPTLGAADRERLRGGGIDVHLKPMEIEGYLSSSTVLMSHAGHGTVSQGLARGCLQILLPAHAEQASLVRRLLSNPNSAARAVALPLSSSPQTLVKEVQRLRASDPPAATIVGRPACLQDVVSLVLGEDGH